MGININLADASSIFNKLSNIKNEAITIITSVLNVRFFIIHFFVTKPEIWDEILSRAHVNIISDMLVRCFLCIRDSAKLNKKMIFLSKPVILYLTLWMG